MYRAAFDNETKGVTGEQCPRCSSVASMAQAFSLETKFEYLDFMANNVSMGGRRHDVAAKRVPIQR